MAVGHHQGESEPLAYRLWELVKVVLPAGCYAFGGPTAHLAVFHDLFVEKLHWLNDQVSPVSVSVRGLIGLKGRSERAGCLVCWSVLCLGRPQQPWSISFMLYLPFL